MCHSFIIGDLIIDHTIFVTDIKGERYQRGQEGTYEVVRRTDMAGGAANCARILAALSDGATYLWGLTGKSHWGSFRAILSHSQAVDGSKNNIEFRGIRDETEAQMNTVSRLIVTKEANGQSVFRFGDRFDETGHLHVPPGKRETAAYYLKRACEKLGQRGKLDVIIINDFDMGCLTKEVVSKIAKFAKKNMIPLFVNPRYEREKYHDIQGTAILTDLKEWCRLANDGKGESIWRNRIAGFGDLSEMAYRSFYHLGNFEYYIIKCGDDGTVFMGPSPEESEHGRYVIWKVPGWLPNHPSRPEPLMTHQIGATDVMTAVFAMEFHRIASSTVALKERTRLAFQALVKANAVVAAYRAMPWHRMPNPDQVRTAIHTAVQNPANDLSGGSYTKNSRGKPREGMRYLPKSQEIVLSRYETSVPGFYSYPRSEFSKGLEQILWECLNGDHSKHMILSGPGGCGKTTLFRFLAKESIKPQHDIQFAFKEGLKSKEDVQTVIDEFLGDSKTYRARVLAVDEALGCGFDDVNHARILLDRLTREKVRLLLADAGFPEKKADLQFRNQIVGRCREFNWMAPDEHPDDIAFIVAGLAFDSVHRLAKARDVNSIQCGGSFLLAFINAMLDEPTVRPWADQMSLAVQNVHDVKSGDPVILCEDHLPNKIKKHLDDDAANVVRHIHFTFKLSE